MRETQPHGGEHRPSAGGESNPRDDAARETDASVGRRAVLGGLTSLLAASAFTLDVPEATATQVDNGATAATQTVASPDGAVSVTVDASDGTLMYSISYRGESVVDPSGLGFEFQSQESFGDDLRVTGTERASHDETWTPIWDQYDEIREQYNELRVGLTEGAAPAAATGRSLTLVVRVFDDGVGFRYVFPEESGFGDFVVTSERTEFAFPADHTSWWVENDFNSYEYQYEETLLSDVGSGTGFDGAHTPITMRTDEGRYLSVHEASLVDYAAMAVEPTGGTTFESTLAPYPDGATKVRASTPHRTPWRTVQVGERPGDLVESNLIVNLNEPYDPAEFPQGTDWIVPEKFLGVWWLMITGRAEWEFMGEQTGNHGAQTGRMKRYMEFASEHGIPNVLVEGWNVGWDSFPGDGSTMDFDEPYPDFDIEAVTEFGRSLDPPVSMTSHNETAGGVSNYEDQLAEDPNPFADYDDLGITSIKTGYVADSGVTIDGTTYNHHCQLMVNHHRLVYREAAKNRQRLEIHEPIKPTGERRTYPNVMTREGVYGQEYDSFGFVAPSHHVTFPFTRMLGGPVEYTPGIFDMDSGSGGIETTRAKQLAMYPTYFSGLHMVADLPSSYLADQPATAGVGEVLQAEFADRDGLSTAARWANAQGGRYVEFDPNTVDPGSSVSWTVEDVDSAGEYTVHLRYASDAEDNAVPAGTPRTGTVRTEGGTGTQVTFPTTAYWDVWSIVSTTVSLSAGDNTLSVALEAGDTGGFNLDSAAVTAVGESMPEPETAPIRGPTVDAFQFIEDVPACGWDDTRVVDAAIGDYSVTARRKDDEWYLGAMTDEDGRALDVPLDFLGPASETGEERGRGNGGGPGNGRGSGPGNGSGGRSDNTPRGPKYVAEIYSDGIEAAYDETLEPVRVDEAVVTPGTTLLASMVGSGGTAVKFRPARGQEISDLPTYERPEQDVAVSIRDEVFVREPFVTATGSNSGDYIGGTTVEVLVDGAVESTTNVRLPPNSSGETFQFPFSIDTAGTYEVSVRTTEGEALASATVTVKPPETVAELPDPTGDDDGPGTYTYPTADAFRDGAFDLESFAVRQTPSIVEFTFEVETLYNAFGSNRGFSPQMFVLWVRDPSAQGGSTSSLDDLGANVDFEEAWQYRFEVSGFTKSAVDATGAALTDADGNSVTPRDTVDTSAGTVTLSVDRAAFDGADPADLSVIPMVQSENFGALRPVAVDAGDFTFGGARAGAVDNAPRVMDLVTPSGVTQADALAYTAQVRAKLPFVPLG